MPWYTGPERRRYKRLTIFLPVKYRLGPRGSIHKAHTIDISAGGAQLGPVSLSNEWMLGSCQIELEIVFPHNPRSIKVMAEVVRVEESKTCDHIHHRRRHNIRLKFCKITEQDKREIQDFVHSRPQ